MWYIKLILAISAYLVGSINFAKIVCHFRKIDITKAGSGNPGTMNVLRTVGKIAGIATFILDGLKTVLFALLGSLYLGSMDWAFILGFITIFGHIFPIYSKFKGGKGVASAIGLYFATQPIAGAVMLTLLIIYMYACKYGFIGSLVLVSVMTAVNIGLYYYSPTIICLNLAVCLLIFIKHLPNIKRFKQGKENTLNLADKKNDNGIKQSDKANLNISSDKKEEISANKDTADTKDKHGEN